MPVSLVVAIVLLGCSSAMSQSQTSIPDSFVRLDANSNRTLVVPKSLNEPPAAGRRVNVISAEYKGSQVFHTLYLPPSWKPGGRAIPIIFEYTGNYFPQSGSTGKSEDAGLGYGLSGGEYIWVVLPYVSKDGAQNEVTWWGDETATINYARLNVPKIIREFGADPNAVFLCGFSRGAIGVNFIGLHDDQVAGLWSAFVTHDHFDGVRKWGNTTWGSPLDRYREQAGERLRRVGNRPYLVSQNGSNDQSERYIKDTLREVDQFTFSYVDTSKALGEFPNQFAKAAHTDRWLLAPSSYRTRTWNWMNQVVKQSTSEH